MSKILELQQERADLYAQMRDAGQQADAAREKGDSTRAAELDKQFDAIEAKERELSERIERLERTEAAAKRAAAEHVEDLEKKGDKPAETELNYRDVFRQYFREGIHGMSTEARAVLEKRGTSNQLVGTTTLGGYTVPTDLVRTIVEAMKDYSGIAQAANIMYTASGNPMTVPTLDDTSTAAIKVAEAATYTVQDLTFGQKPLDAYAYRTGVKVSWELLQDSAFDFDGLIRGQFGTRFGRALNNTCTLGDGSGDPNGIVTATSAGKTAASTTGITFAELLDLVHSIDPAYRRSPSCGFMFHDGILNTIKKLSIGSGDARPLWQPSFREGEPDRIDGYRYWLNQDMASSASASAKVALFGDFSYYTIRMVNSMQIKRLDERYADDGLVGYLGFMRWDGELMNTSAVKHYVMAAS